VVAPASEIDLEGVAGRVLFPSVHQGPWPRSKRFAESEGRGSSEPELHEHQLEADLNYVLAGTAFRTNGRGQDVEVPAGLDLSHLAFRGPYAFEVSPSGGHRVVAHTLRGAPRVENRPVPRGSGYLRENLLAVRVTGTQGDELLVLSAPAL